MYQSSKKKTKVLVAGSTGYVGHVLTQKLLDENFFVICIIRSGNLKKIDFQRRKNLKIIQCNICDRNSVEIVSKNAARADVIISCLGSRHGSAQESNDVEYEANINLVKIGTNLGAKQFILVSAICVQKPYLLFQKAKIKFETYLKDSNIKWTIIRPTAFFKSLSSQINRVLKGKPFIVFDSGVNNKCKPISRENLSEFICNKILATSSFNKTFIIGGPGPALTPIEQGTLLFKIAGRPEKFSHIPSVLFKIIALLITPITPLLKPAKDFKEFMKIAFYYGTESMLKWDDNLGQYDEKQTPEFGEDTLEEFYRSQISSETLELDLPDKRLFR